MATTYLDYVIKYGGVVKSTNTNTGLTSIVIKYGTDTKATITTNTTKTLPMSGKYCNKNITIGAKTLPTSGKYANQNVTVETSKRYRWNKYNSVTVYSRATVSGNPFSSSTNLYSYFTPHTSAKYGHMYVNGVSATQPLNSSTGLYTMASHSSYGTISNGAPKANAYSVLTNQTNGSIYCTLSQSNYVTWTNNSTDRTLEAFRQGTCYIYASLSATYGSGSSTMYYQGGAVTTPTYKIMTGASEGQCWAYGTLNYTTSSWGKGSTSYGQVNSTSSSAYPTNGRASDGYWYVAV